MYYNVEQSLWPDLKAVVCLNAICCQISDQLEAEITIPAKNIFFNIKLLDSVQLKLMCNLKEINLE